MCALLALTGCGVFHWEQIPPASAGIKFNMNSGVSQNILKPQVTYVGLRDKLIVYPTSIKNASYVANEIEGEHKNDDSIRASTIEGATLPMDVTVAWHVDAANVRQAFLTFGTADLDEIQEKFIRWTTVYAVNCVSGNMAIFDLTSRDRATFGPMVKQKLSPLLSDMGLTVDNVMLGEAYPPKDIKAKVDERLGVKNSLSQAQIDLERAGQEAKKTLIDAQKQTELNRQLAAQGDKALRLKRMEIKALAIAKWKGDVSEIGESKIPFTDIVVR